MCVRMKSQLLDAFDHPEAKNCFYSFNMEWTGVPRLDALSMFDWTPELTIENSRLDCELPATQPDKSQSRREGDQKPRVKIRFQFQRPNAVIVLENR